MTQRLRWIAIALLAVGCKKNAPAEQPPLSPTVPAVQDESASCTMSVNKEGMVVVDGQPTQLSAEELGADTNGWKPLWPALYAQGNHYLAGGERELFRVPCAPPHQPVSIMTRADASFARSALSANGEALFFTDGGKVAALHLSDRRIESLTTPPKLESCWDSEPGEDVRSATDRVLGLAHDGAAVAFERGGPCGFEGDWSAAEHHLVDPLNAAKRGIHAITPVTSVAVDAGGAIWVTDGGRCEEPGITDPSTRALYTSPDRGKTWRKVMTKTSATDSEAGARQVLADSKRPGHIVALDVICSSSAALIGGSVRITRDAGKSWSYLSIPDTFETMADDGHGVANIALVEGSIDGIVIWSQASEGKPATAWQTLSGGQSWSKHKQNDAPTAAGAPLKLGTLELKPTAHGLIAIEGTTERLLFVPGKQ